MEQAYTHFNSGKYKQALNILNTGNQNVESYQPNVAICEYLSNRCTQSAINCLRKLNDILNKKQKPEEDSVQLRTQQIIKYNIVVILILLGKRNNALPLIRELYQQRECFIEYIQCRILLLLMELEITMFNSIDALILYHGFPNKPVELKNPPNQWISVGFHDHNKSSVIASQQFDFLSQIFIGQALIQLGFPDNSIPSVQIKDKKKQALLDRFRKRKNSINKYYQINLLMIDRFYQAQRQLHNNNINKCLSLLNLSHIQQQYQQIPLSKITINLLNSLSMNNIGLVHLYLGKNCLALYFFKKAKQLLTKGSTAQDRQLQLFITNYLNQQEKISENIALVLISIKSQQAHTAYNSLTKANHNSANYKFWYRFAQTQIQQYHQLQQEKPDVKNNYLLENALSALSTSLACLNKTKKPNINISKYYNYLKEDQIQTVIMRIKGEQAKYKVNITLLICYVSLCLGLYSRTIKLCTELLATKKLNTEEEFYANNYLIQAYVAIDRLEDAHNILLQNQKKLNEEIFFVTARADSKSQMQLKQYDQQTLLLYQIAVLNIKQGRLPQALNIAQILRQKTITSKCLAIKTLQEYLSIRMKINQKNLYPYMRIN